MKLCYNGRVLKRITVLTLLLAASILTTGCGKDGESIAPPEKVEWQPESADAVAEETGKDQPENDAESAEDSGAQEGERDGKNEIPAEKEPLSGKIQKIAADGMILAQTTVWVDREGGSGEIRLVDEEEAEKISVRFADDVKVEYWKIAGGGADIEKQDRTLADLSIGDGVEMEGYYDGEVYVATLILIEEYVSSNEVQTPETGAEELTGSISSVGVDSFVVSRSTTEHYDGYDLEVAAAPGTEGEELVTVRMAGNAVYQYRTVKNSGINPEDVTSREGSYADLQEGLSVILQGSWQDDVFYAGQIVMLKMI